jgi:hypothetical protein
MEAVKSLKQIGVQEHFYGKTLIAIINDKVFYSEADDIVRTVSLMAGAKKELESHYAKR